MQGTSADGTLDGGTIDGGNIDDRRYTLGYIDDGRRSGLVEGHYNLSYDALTGRITQRAGT